MTLNIQPSGSRDSVASCLREGCRFLLTQHFVESKTELLRDGAPFKKMKTLFMKVGFMLQPKVLRY